MTAGQEQALLAWPEAASAFAELDARLPNCVPMR